MKNVTLEQVLATQDMGKIGIDKICDAVMEDSFDYEKDPLTGYIIKVFVDNDYINYESMVTDLNYAINQLTRAKKEIESVLQNAD